MATRRLLSLSRFKLAFKAASSWCIQYCMRVAQVCGVAWAPALRRHSNCWQHSIQKKTDYARALLRASRCTVSLSPRSPGSKTAGPFRHKCGGTTLLSPFQQKGVSYRQELINITGFPNDSKKRTNTGECVTMKPSYFFSSAREENKEHMNLSARDKRCFFAVSLIALHKGHYPSLF